MTRTQYIDQLIKHLQIDLEEYQKESTTPSEKVNNLTSVINTISRTLRDLEMVKTHIKNKPKFDEHQ